MNITPKKAIVAGLAAATLAGGAALALPSLASAHDGGGRGAKAELVAETLGMTVDDLKAARAEGQSLAEIAGDDFDALVDAMVAAATDRVDAKVAEGDITQEEADERLADLEAKITERANQAPGERGEGRMGHFGRRGGRMGESFRGGAQLESIAETLDLTVDELRAAVADGQSLADIAGDDLDAVIDQMVASAAEKIDAKVADGDITREQADERLAELETKIEERADQALGQRGERRRGHRHHRGDAETEADA